MPVPLKYQKDYIGLAEEAVLCDLTYRQLYFRIQEKIIKPDKVVGGEKRKIYLFRKVKA